MKERIEEYINYLCKRYNKFSEEKAYHEAGMSFVYDARNHSSDKMSELAFTISCLCETVGAPEPKMKDVEGHKIAHDENYDVIFTVYDI